jgi:hypothetical protein
LIFLISIICYMVPFIFTLLANTQG